MPSCPAPEQLFPPDVAERLAPFLLPRNNPGGGDFFCISRAGIDAAAALLQIPARQAMLYCLQRGVWPLRFQKNRGFFTAGEQVRLLQSHVAIIGCGGLGGYAMTLLARLGLGELTLCDDDVFDESNLNRQLLCREDSIGVSKVLAAREALARIASHMTVRAHECRARPETLPGILGTAQAVLDCLDSIAARRVLEQAAHEAGIAFIHGAIAGQEGFALCSRPDGPQAMTRLYGSASFSDDPGPEEPESADERLGTPAPTPAATAVMQVMLVLRVLLDKEEGQPGTMWHLDLSAPFLDILHW